MIFKRNVTGVLKEEGRKEVFQLLVSGFRLAGNRKREANHACKLLPVDEQLIDIGRLFRQ